jgi:Lar family restriction alleviation protein
MKTGKTGSGQTVGDACRAVIENGTASLSPDIVERIGKVEVKSCKSAIEKAHAEAHEHPDVCDLRCLRNGGACGREVCTSACKLTANIEMVEAEKREAIAPCPLCGGVAKHTFGMNEHWVSCAACGASGPMADTKQKALDVWNTRPVNLPDGLMMVRRDVVGNLLDALDNIGNMAAYDAEIGLTVGQVARAYEEARELANLSLGLYARQTGGGPRGDQEKGRALEAVRVELDGVKAWRDPAVEMPDDDISVIGRFESEDYPVYATLHDEHGWGPADGCGGTYTDKLTGWMHIHEAAEILDAARKEVRS